MEYHSIDFFSSCKNAYKVEEEIVDECCRYFEAHDIFAIKLALDEALTNAIKHGNKMNPLKMVHVSYYVDCHFFEVIIEDDGSGFDVTQVPDPIDEENIEKSSGRGLLLMREYMDRVEHNYIGNIVTMKKLHV